MAVWAIADLHLSKGVPDKAMDLFGPNWLDHDRKIERNWTALIKPEDLVLIAGDISWAMHPEQAKHDLDWIHQLPGTKVLLRGNHDFWWASLSKVQKLLPPSLHLIQNNAFSWQDFIIGGARLWDTAEYSFNDYIEYRGNPKAQKKTEASEHSEQENIKIFQRELQRLETSLKAMNATAKPGQKRLVMTHYPPIGAELQPSRTSALLEKYCVDTCVFGHLHNVKVDSLPFGTRNGVRYVLTACDAIGFTPVRLY